MITQYTGRVVDVVALQRPSNTSSTTKVQLTQALFAPGNAGQVVTGIAKLVQRFALEFLTIQGSMRFAPTRGTQFLREFQRGALRTEFDIVNEFEFAVVTIRQNLQGEETTAWPTDERFDNAQLLSLTITQDALKLSIKIYSLAGGSRNVILPISTLG